MSKISIIFCDKKIYFFTSKHVHGQVIIKSELNYQRNQITVLFQNIELFHTDI